ncbi:MAG TPA: 16S rRNA (guanine(527)-N(7))-methyltransferase RsmG, partial [Chlorobaculum parvum]|nr:16S rRNA (guanine(527)-N(7))-methyltransferase RsmG [Chlorobaculum parvum]
MSALAITGKIAFFSDGVFFHRTRERYVMPNDLQLLERLCREHSIPAKKNALKLLVHYTE